LKKNLEKGKVLFSLGKLGKTRFSNFLRFFFWIDLFSAFGQVFRGVHKESGISLAIKVLPTKDQAIEKEVELMKAMRNAAIVSYYGTCKTKHNFWVGIDFL
jgi:hypothetical protein